MITNTYDALDPPTTERIRGLLIQKRLLEQQAEPDLSATHGRSVFRTPASIRRELGELDGDEE